jgi:hypothetical protein
MKEHAIVIIVSLLFGYVTGSAVGTIATLFFGANAESVLTTVAAVGLPVAVILYLTVYFTELRYR